MKFIVQIILFFFPLVLEGQQLPVQKVDTIQIKGTRLQPLQHEIYRYNNDNDGSPIEQLLHAGPLHLQSNGPGVLTTPLIHGMGARHVAILWNEMNIQSPINGTFDLSLLNNPSQTISIIPHSISPQHGTSSLAGALILSQRDKSFFTFKANQMKNYDLAGNISKEIAAGQRISLSTMLSHHQNQYRYQYGSQTEKRKFADQQGVDIQIGYKNKRIDMAVWYQEYSRKIPPSITAIYTDAKQYDQNLRWSTNYKITDRIKLKGGYFHEILNYQDNSVESTSINNAFLINVDYSKSGKQVMFSWRSDNVNANFYNQNWSRTIFSIAYQYTKSINRHLSVYAIIREEYDLDTFSPLLGDLNIKYENDSKIYGAFSIDRSFNRPTFNDLYWPLGGDDELNTEKALGLDFSIGRRAEDFTWILNPYYKSVDDWILWLPGPTYWSPRNQLKVVAKGLDASTSMRKDFFGWVMSSDLFLNIGKTTISEDIQQRNIIGNQLIFVPQVRISSSIAVSNDNWRYSVTMNYTGKRYTTSDNLTVIDAFNLWNVEVDKRIFRKLKAGLEINNVFNQDYEINRFYPMPLRYVGLTLKYE